MVQTQAISPELLLNGIAAGLGLGLLFFLLGGLLGRLFNRKFGLTASLGLGLLAGGACFALLLLTGGSRMLPHAVASGMLSWLGLAIGLRTSIFRRFSGDNFEFYFARKITFKSHRSVSRLVVTLAVLTISLGVAVMEISMSIVGGFKAEIQNKVVGFGSHLQIGNFLADLESSITPLPLKNDFVPAIRELEGVESVSPYIVLPAMIKSPETLEGIVLKGVSDEYDFRFFEEKLLRGRLPDFSGEKESREVLVSKKLADLLLVDTAARARLFFMDDPPRLRPVRISGVYETGLEEFDAITVLCDQRMLQKILRWEDNEVAGFEVKLSTLELLEEYHFKILDMLPTQYDSYPITEIYPEIFDWLELQNQNVWAILILMILIAVINMSTVVLILIIERTQTIGMLKALGLSNGRVIRVFVFNALILVAFGVLLGNVIGLGLIWAQDAFEFITVDQENYFVATVPVKWVWGRFLLVNLGVIAICTLCMFLPTLAISRITPVKAIRFQ